MLLIPDRYQARIFQFIWLVRVFIILGSKKKYEKRGKSRINILRIGDTDKKSDSNGGIIEESMEKQFTKIEKII